MKSKGIIYSVYGRSHVNEAIESIKSVKRHMPDIPITVFSNKHIHHRFINGFYKFRPDLSPEENVIVSLLRSPYDITLYLDSDVYADDSFEELFEMMENFDLGVVMDPVQSAIPDGNSDLRGFPLYNCGVICCKSGPRLQKFVKEWLEQFKQYESNADQPAFRKAIYNSDIRYVTLPPTYNCLYGAFPGYLNGPVKLFHGRLRATDGAKGLRMKYDPVRARTRLNATSEPRVYRHGLGIQVHTESRLARLLHLMRVWGPRAALRELRRHMR